MELKIGDKVTIRRWEDMVKEFGYDGSSIHCDASFTNEMRYLCGLEAYVVGFLGTSNNKLKFAVSLKKDSSFTEGWTISVDMIEKETIFDNKFYIGL